MDQKTSQTDPIGWRRLTGWVRRALRAMRADLELVDCGSLEVLLICGDDLAPPGASRATDRRIDR
jgi:hypothetical protein